VGLNDFGFTDPVTVVITVSPNGSSSGVVGANDGSVDAINGSGGPIADVTIDFTPAALPGTLTYDETFTYQVTDAAMVTTTAVVTVTVNNTLPNAVAANASAAEGAMAATDVAALAGVDLGDPPVTITEASAPVNGTTAVAGTVITYTPTGFFTGTDSYDYTITDIDGETSTATVTVTIGPKLSPTANPDIATVDQDATVTINVTANDIAGSGALAAHTVAVSTGASNGAASVGAGNVIIYTPAAGFSGGDIFQYTLTDADDDSSTTSVTVTITPAAVTPPPGGGGPGDEIVVPLPSSSAADPWSLALLLALPWLRRRQPEDRCSDRRRGER